MLCDEPIVLQINVQNHKVLVLSGQIVEEAPTSVLQGSPLRKGVRLLKQVFLKVEFNRVVVLNVGVAVLFNVTAENQFSLLIHQPLRLISLIRNQKLRKQFQNFDLLDLGVPLLIHGKGVNRIKKTITGR